MRSHIMSTAGMFIIGSEKRDHFVLNANDFCHLLNCHQELRASHLACCISSCGLLLHRSNAKKLQQASLPEWWAAKERHKQWFSNEIIVCICSSHTGSEWGLGIPCKRSRMTGKKKFFSKVQAHSCCDSRDIIIMNEIREQHEMVPVSYPVYIFSSTLIISNS